MSTQTNPGLLASYLDGHSESRLKLMLTEVEDHEKEVAAERTLIERALARKRHMVKQVDAQSENESDPQKQSQRVPRGVVLEAVAKVGGPAMYDEVLVILEKDGVSMKREAVIQAMRTLEEKGELIKVERGLFTVPDSLGERPLQ